MNEEAGKQKKVVRDANSIGLVCRIRPTRHWSNDSDSCEKFVKWFKRSNQEQSNWTSDPVVTVVHGTRERHT